MKLEDSSAAAPKQPGSMEEIRECMEQANLMVDILSNIIEFRNGESGTHVMQIRLLTEMLLEELRCKTDQYALEQSDILRVSLAAAIHDIGKIAVPNEILNKYGRLTQVEFSVMKDHTLIGANMVKELPLNQEEPLVKTAYEICRWHHERYDGSGYPDGLQGEQIPISAQVVGLADVYSTMTTDRIYKKALSHDEVIEMLLEGKCGAFHPVLLECLKSIADQIPGCIACGSTN